ncbi:MAG: FmdB family transcriptional regulator [Propionibacteriaceae bacterium]|jgi:putative FmdB family regulatory protein|nr:FmdB family transcriptional regulator [Propionibacteriaceae bacterium]
MPIYQYHCTSCGADLEIFQHMVDPTLTVCPECQGQLRKVFSPVGIVFKGSGFYATDSKKSSSTTSLPASPAAPHEPAPASPAAPEKTAAPASPAGSAGSASTPNATGTTSASTGATTN